MWQHKTGKPKVWQSKNAATQKLQQKCGYRLRIAAVPSQSKFLSIYDEQNLLWEEWSIESHHHQDFQKIKKV